MISLKFKNEEDGSGCGTLIISKDGYEFLFVPICHTRQLVMMDDIVGDYNKV